MLWTIFVILLVLWLLDWSAPTRWVDLFTSCSSLQLWC